MPRACRLVFAFVAVASMSGPAVADSLPADASYRPLPTLPFEETKASDEAAEAAGDAAAAAGLRTALRPLGPADSGRDDVRRAKAGAGRRAGQAAGRA